MRNEFCGCRTMAVGRCPKIPPLYLSKMGLNIDQVKKAIQTPKKAGVISKAVTHQNRIKFHAETHITPYISMPLTSFLAWVNTLIPHDKAKIFKTLFRYPVKTNEVTGIVFDKLSRVFDGRNPVFNYQFINSEQRDDWEYYRQEVLREPDIWQTKGWEYFKTEINSVLIVDLAVEQPAGDKYPAPYFYWLPINEVINYDANPTTGIMDFIIFRQPDNKIAVIDDERYRIFEGKAGDVGAELVNNPHDLGYCPAKFFWNEPLSLKEPDVKLHPLSKELSALDWFLFFHTSKKQLDISGAYPVYWGFEQDCDFSNTQTGDYCDGGFLKDKEEHYKIDQYGLLRRCPKCGDKRITGAGSFVEVPIPNETEGIPDLREPVGMLTIDRQSLDYNVEEEERLRNEIIDAVVGVDSGVINDSAINEKQVTATFENKTTVLNRIKKGFEEAQTFVDTTAAKLRYGNLFISGDVNLGTEFYDLSAKELRDIYKTAKESGASEAELDAMQNQIYETEYRHDPTQLQRMLTLAELEPYRHYSRSEVMDLYSKQLIDETELRIKLNFSNFVRRFERENTNILEFGNNIPFDKKIAVITNKFKDYANESKS